MFRDERRKLRSEARIGEQSRQATTAPGRPSPPTEPAFTTPPDTVEE